MFSLHRTVKKSLSRHWETNQAWRTRAAPSQAGPEKAKSALPEHQLVIACIDPTQEETARDVYQSRGLFLARQDRWAELAQEIRLAEKTKRITPSAMPAAELLSFGARSDVVTAVEHALYDGAPTADAPLSSGINALEEMLSDAGADMMLSAVVAQAHIDLAWAWRGASRTRQVQARNAKAFETHFNRAHEILAPFDMSDTQSSSLATAKCGLHGAGREHTNKLIVDYEHLIDLDPRNPAPMRALGTFLTPSWFGTYQQLEVEARRTAARTQKIWGAGAYTWVMFDALSRDDTACDNLDVAFFLEGIDDILRRVPNQHVANLLAAYCANFGAEGRAKREALHPTRRRIAACADWIVRDYMTELHPMIWAHAEAGFGNESRGHSARSFAASGRTSAHRIITNLFKREIAAGQCIVFTADGPVTQPQ